MNKFIQIFVLSLSLFLISCQKKSSDGAAPVDLAKLEQLKKLLAEQLSPVATVTAPEAETANSDSDPNRQVSIRPNTPSVTILEGLTGSFGVLVQTAAGQESSVNEAVMTLPTAGIAEISTTTTNARYVIKALAPGRVVAKIVYKGFETSIEIIVKAKEVLSVEIYPKSISLGTPSRFKLLAVFNNNTTGDLTTGVSWQSIDTKYLQSNAQSAASGIFTGAKVGLAGIRAVYGTITVISRIDIQMPRIQSIAVSAETDSFLLGSSDVPVAAIATFVGGNTFNIASSVTWSVVDPLIIAITGEGILEATFPGDTVVKAQYGTISGSANFFVTSENFSSFRLAPTTASTPVGLAAPFKLYGVRTDTTERDITAYARWTIDDTSIAYSGTTLSPKEPGKIYGSQTGSTPIHARYGSTILNGTVTVTNPAVLSLTGTMEQDEGACGVATPTFKIDGQMSDGSTKDMSALVTYTVNPPDLALPHTDVSSAGKKFTTLKIGTGTITASYIETATGQTLTVVKPIVSTTPVQTGIGIIAASTSIAFGDTLYLKSQEKLSCGTGLDFTNASAWLTNNTSTTMNALIDGATTKGFFSSIEMSDPPLDSTPKVIKASAIKGTLRYDLDITVREKEVRTIEVVPLTFNMDVGTTMPVQLFSTFSDLTESDMTTIASYPGYTSQFAILDCVATGCATIDPVTGILTAGTVEGTVQVYASLSTPQGIALAAAKVNVNVRSRCDVALGGVRAGNYCVWLAARGASCDTKCDAVIKGGVHGTYHEATDTAFGKTASSGGSCSIALTNLGWVPGLQTASQAAGLGVGCSIWNIVALGTRRSIRDTSDPATTGAALHADYERVCACREPP